MRINALYHAVVENNIKAVRELLDSGVNNSDPYKVVMIAIQKGHCDIMKELLKSENFNLKSIEIPYGMPTPLYEAAHKNNLEMINLLLSYGADPKSVLCFPDFFLTEITTDPTILSRFLEVGVQNYQGMTVGEALRIDASDSSLIGSYSSDSSNNDFSTIG